VTLGLNIKFKGYVYRQPIYTVREGSGSTTTLSLEVFTQRNFILVADFVGILLTKMTNSVFEPHFGGVRGNVRTLSVAHWKARGRLPIRDNETFFTSSYSSDPISSYWSKSAFFKGDGPI